jgi:hypothetical protein
MTSGLILEANIRMKRRKIYFGSNFMDIPIFLLKMPTVYEFLKNGSVEYSYL